MAQDQTRRRRWPYFGGQGALALAGVAMLIGSALPWAYILGRLLWASPLALMWSFCAGLVTVAAALAPWRWVVVLSALGGGATGVYFAVWQSGRIVDVCGVSLDCFPGPGVALLLAGGITALFRGAQLARAGA